MYIYCYTVVCIYTEKGKLQRKQLLIMTMRSHAYNIYIYAWQPGVEAVWRYTNSVSRKQCLWINPPSICQKKVKTLIGSPMFIATCTFSVLKPKIPLAFRHQITSLSVYKAYLRSCLQQQPELWCNDVQCTRSETTQSRDMRLNS